MRYNLHTGGVKGFTDLIRGLIGIFCNLKLLDLAAQHHKICTVVFEVNKAVGIHHRCANAILRLSVIRSKEHLRGLIGFGVAVARIIIGFGISSIHRLSSAGSVA